MKRFKVVPEGYKRIGEMAREAGVSVRMLSYYDKEGLLVPSAESEVGYRLYNDKDGVRLVQILMLKELGFSLREIKARLGKLDTPEEVRGMLAEQIAQVRRRIASLNASLAAMEALNGEITEMETVNFKKYAAILLNLKVKNERYWMIKYFDDDALDKLRGHVGQEKVAMMTATLNDLYKEAAKLIKKRVSPEGGKGRRFAEKLWLVLLDLTGGDMEMMQILNEQIEKAIQFDKGGDAERMQVQAFMGQALKMYHGHHPTQGDMDAKMMQFGIKANAEAYQMHREKVSPESEQAQAFIKNFWETMLGFVGGDMEKLFQLNAQAKQMGLHDKKEKIAAEFIEAAMMFFFKNPKKQAEGVN